AYDTQIAPDPSGLLGCQAPCGVIATVVPPQGAAAGEQTAALLLVQATPAPDANVIGAAEAVGARARVAADATPSLTRRDSMCFIVTSPSRATRPRRIT